MRRDKHSKSQPLQKRLYVTFSFWKFQPAISVYFSLVKTLLLGLSSFMTAWGRGVGIFIRGKQNQCDWQRRVEWMMGRTQVGPVSQNTGTKVLQVRDIKKICTKVLQSGWDVVLARVLSSGLLNYEFCTSCYVHIPEERFKRLWEVGRWFWWLDSQGSCYEMLLRSRFEFLVLNESFIVSDRKKT